MAGGQAYFWMVKTMSALRALPDSVLMVQRSLMVKRILRVLMASAMLMP